MTAELNIEELSMTGLEIATDELAYGTETAMLEGTGEALIVNGAVVRIIFEDTGGISRDVVAAAEVSKVLVSKVDEGSSADVVLRIILEDSVGISGDVVAAADVSKGLVVAVDEGSSADVDVDTVKV